MSGLALRSGGETQRLRRLRLRGTAKHQENKDREVDTWDLASGPAAPAGRLRRPYPTTLAAAWRDQDIENLHVAAPRNHDNPTRAPHPLDRRRGQVFLICSPIDSRHLEASSRGLIETHLLSLPLFLHFPTLVR